MVTRSAPLPLLAFTLTTLAWAGPAAAQTSANKPAAPAAATPDSAAIERQLTAAVRRHPDSFEAQYALAEFYVQRGKLTAAIPHLERARSIDPAHYASGYNLVLGVPRDRQARRRPPAGDGHAGGEGDGRAPQPAGRRRRARRQPGRGRRGVSAGRARRCDRGPPVRLGEQPAAAPRIRAGDGSVLRRRRAVSEVGEAADRAGDRALFARAVRRCRSIVLPGVGSGAVRSPAD